VASRGEGYLRHGATAGQQATALGQKRAVAGRSKPAEHALAPTKQRGDAQERCREAVKDRLLNDPQHQYTEPNHDRALGVGPYEVAGANLGE
jgi:hypothetical protein